MLERIWVAEVTGPDGNVFREFFEFENEANETIHTWEKWGAPSWTDAKKYQMNFGPQSQFAFEQLTILFAVYNMAESNDELAEMFRLYIKDGKRYHELIKERKYVERNKDRERELAKARYAERSGGSV